MIHYKDKHTYPFGYIKVATLVVVLMLLIVIGFQLFQRWDISKASYSMMLNPTSGTIFGGNTVEVSLESPIKSPEYQLVFKIENSGDPIKDYQLPLTFDSQEYISRGQMDSACKDIRVTDINRAPLPFVIGTGCNTTQALVWVKTEELVRGENVIRLFFGYTDEQKQYAPQDIFIANQITKTEDSFGGGTRYGRFENAEEADFIRKQFDWNYPNLSFTQQVFANNLKTRSYVRYRFVFIPDETEEYIFYTDSDDASELRMSSSDDLIDQDAEVLVSWYGAHNSRNSCLEASQPIKLTQGNMYWLDYLSGNQTGSSLANMCLQKGANEPKTLTVDDYRNQIFTRLYSPFVTVSSASFGVNEMYIMMGEDRIDDVRITDSGYLSFVTPKFDVRYGTPQTGGAVNVSLHQLSSEEIISETKYVYRDIELNTIVPAQDSLEGGSRIRLTGQKLFTNVDQMVGRISYSGDEVLNYQAKFSFDSRTLVESGKLNSRCSNMMIVDQDDVTELPYIVTSGCGTDSTVVWTKIPVLNKSYERIRIRYGNINERGYRIGDVFIPNLIYHSTNKYNLTWRSIVSEDQSNEIRADNDGVDGNYVTTINDAEGGNHFYRRYRFLYIPQVDGSFTFITNSGDASETMITIEDNYGDGPNSYLYSDGNIVSSWYGNHNNNPDACDGTGSTYQSQKLKANQPIWIDYVMHETTGSQQAQLCIQINDDKPALIDSLAQLNTYYSRTYLTESAEPIIKINDAIDQFAYIQFGDNRITDFEIIDESTIEFVAPPYHDQESLSRSVSFVSQEGFVSNELDFEYVEKSPNIEVTPDYIIRNSCDKQVFILEDLNIFECKFELDPTYEYSMPKGGVQIQYAHEDTGALIGTSECKLTQNEISKALVCNSNEPVLVPYDGAKPMKFVTKENKPQQIGVIKTVGKVSIDSPRNIVFSSTEVTDTITTVCSAEFNVRAHDSRYGSAGYGVNLATEDLIDSYSGTILETNGNLHGEVLSVVDIYNSEFEPPEFLNEFYFEKDNQQINIMKTSKPNSHGIYRIKMRLCLDIPPYTPQGSYVGGVEFSTV